MIKSALRIIFLSILLSASTIFTGTAYAVALGSGSTIAVSSCSQSQVQSAISQANDGDIVRIPSGTCTWTSPIVVSNMKAIVIQGAGIGNTIIINEVVKTDWQDTPFWINSVEGKPFRITGIEFRGGTTAGNSYFGAIHIRGTSKNWRIDHCRFYHLNTRSIRTANNNRGVIDHCQFLYNVSQAIEIEHDSYGGANFGDGSFAAPLALGTIDATYIEDNTFEYDGSLSEHNWGCLDGWSGSRVVFRYNTVTNSYWLNHGLETVGRQRSMRSFEIYNNTFNHTGGNSWFTAIHIRGGTGVIYNNTFSGNYEKSMLATNYRSNSSYSPWGKCDGSSPYDGNSGSPTGYPCIDQIGRGTGTLLSGSTPTPQAWPNQASEPLYEWGNTFNGSDTDIESNVSHVQAGRDFFNDTQMPGYTPFIYPHPATNIPTPPPSVDMGQQ